jgi:hypothetical protein
VRSPNLNAYSERWVRSVKEECLSKVLLIGERSLRLARPGCAVVPNAADGTPDLLEIRLVSLRH